MTGIGGGSGRNQRVRVAVEVRSVNNRHLKVSVRAPQAYLALENNVEKQVRRCVTRGSISISLRVERLDDCSEYAFNPVVLRAYAERVRDLAAELKLAAPTDLSPLLALPGVVTESDLVLLEEEDWPVVEAALGEALEKLNAFRSTEGGAMQQELRSLCEDIDGKLNAIDARRPDVAAGYRQRLQERISDLLAEFPVNITEADLLREAALFAERSDINEEITRLRCHVEQCRALLSAEESSGRKLEFLCQEMFREINTIGSKANDVQIAHWVVETKAAVERMREIVQNVE